MPRSNKEEIALDVPDESSTKPTQTRQQEPTSVAMTRFAANNPNVAIAAGAGLIAGGIVLTALQN